MLSADPVFPAAGELPAGLGAVFEEADTDPVPVPVDVGADTLKGIVRGSTGFPWKPHASIVPVTCQVNPRAGIDAASPGAHR